MDVSLLCKKTKSACNEFMFIDTATKNNILLSLKILLLENKDKILEENNKDIILAKFNGQNEAFIDRLTFNEKRIFTMANGIDDVIALHDPVGQITDKYQRGELEIEKRRSPLGVIGIIYEARPNVTIDASILCLKSGNGVILKGSKDCVNANNYLVNLVKKALKIHDIDENLVNIIDSSDRKYTMEMLKMSNYLDVVIPRGSEKLKSFVLENATMPVIASAGGNCHIYVSKFADLDMAKNIILNSKIQRPSVCNALETLLIDNEIKEEFAEKILKMLAENGVEIRGGSELKNYYEKVKIVDDDEFFCEYSQLIIKVKFVNGVDMAITHINTYGTNHSDCIITDNKAEASRFVSAVDSSAVYVNTSTRFTDGFELGLGAEMGISTQKLHVRGPIGLKELTSEKYVITSNGAIRK